MRRTAMIASLAMSFLYVSPQLASAGGYKSSCYEQAVIPATYRTVAEKVLVQPASQRVVRQPAVYGYRTKRVVVQPERVSYRAIAPVYQTRHQRVLVQPASTGWEYQYRHGKKVLCKVTHPAVYKTVAQTVLVKPGGKVAVRHPAIYGTVQEKYILQHASKRVVHQPAVYRTVHRKVKVSNQQVVWRPVSSKCRH
ncbi:hypothetical protein JM93_01271 [Roseibium hamelinense]|uniref:YXWGXW repeat-containing protein n=1 Tax=Roseibium hamelinense TaxID=150831 RepID=A0A562T9H0_9HYPH|nr:hypothetical protein [Roseibium hamelinense]TWI90291.1 hypothetical protein JM93_01271 [Roseibium hamelinense]